jgi:hypothetical protein
MTSSANFGGYGREEVGRTGRCRCGDEFEAPAISEGEFKEGVFAR